MTHSEHSSLHTTVAADAADWFVTLQAQDVLPADKEAFAGWLRRSPVHVEEFLRLTALQGDLARLPELKTTDVARLISEAAQEGASENVVPFAERFQARGDLSSGRWRARPMLAASLAAVLVFTIGLFAFNPLREFLETQRFSTQTGEQRSLTLEDGSHVQLNTRSTLTAKVDHAIRDVHLNDGEALFQVAKDPARPFRVHTPQAMIEAKGTQFNVYVKGDETFVALIEGKIDVAPSGRSDVITLSPGQQITIASRTTARPAPRPADIERVIAWTERRLVFEDAPLSEVIAELNRYSRQPLAIEDPALRGVRITASFDSQNTQTFVDSLATAGNLRIHRRPDGTWLIVR